MDKVGIQGDIWSEVRNIHSRRVYLILPQPELGSDYWVTHIFSLDVHFISSLPVMQGTVYRAWVDSKPVQRVWDGD